jgi:hypothetical protein
MIKNFRTQKLKEIKIWAWAAVVLPITSSAALFFAWALGLDTILQKMLVVGATLMFAVAVVWWWWAIWTIAKVTDLLGSAMDGIKEVKKDLASLKEESN